VKVDARRAAAPGPHDERRKRALVGRANAQPGTDATVSSVGRRRVSRVRQRSCG
jgi:hypothetical protein